MTILSDIKNNQVAGCGLLPAVLGSGANLGAAVDMGMAAGPITAQLMTGAVGGTSPTLDVKMQESETSGGTYTDISGATFTQVTAANQFQTIRFNRTKRYVRFHGTVGGSSTPTVAACGLIQGQKLQF